MAVDPDFLDHVKDLFASLGPIRKGRMFSGVGLYLEDDAMFAVVLGDTVFMKSDNDTVPAYRDAGSIPFSYERKNGTRTITSLMSLPDSAMDDPEEAMQWARLSLAPARAAAQKRSKNKR